MQQTKEFAKALLATCVQSLVVALACVGFVASFIKSLSVLDGKNDLDAYFNYKFILFLILILTLILTTGFMLIYIYQSRNQKYQAYRFSRRHYRELLVQKSFKDNVIKVLNDIGCVSEKINIDLDCVGTTTITTVFPHQRGHYKIVSEDALVDRQDWMRERNLRVTVKDSDGFSKVFIECWPTTKVEYLDMTETSYYLLEHVVSLLERKS